MLALGGACEERGRLCPEGQWRVDDRCEARDAGSDAGLDAGPCAEGCAAPTPLCRSEDDTCVECLGDGDCPGARCAVEAGRCVTCLGPADCPDPERARCDEAFTCAPCEGPADCVAHSGRGVCHEGACVECAPGEHTACTEGELCHGRRRACEAAVAGSRLECEPCIADAHCASGSFCVEPARGGEEGYFCLPARGASCGRPFAEVRSGVESIDGTLVDVCRHRRTSCAGYNAFSTSPEGCAVEADALVSEGDAPGDGACGLVGGEDFTRCRPLGGAAGCTFVCGGDIDCPLGFPCTGGADRFCALVGD